MTLAAGTKLGSYEIVAPVGSGGMGEVYRAPDDRASAQPPRSSAGTPISLAPAVPKPGPRVSQSSSGRPWVG